MFNVIPGNFFTPLSSPNRIVYWDCICRLYSITEGQLAFGVERDVLADELQYYFEQDMAADIVDEDFAASDSRGKANGIIRRLEFYGWIEIDTDKSYIQRVNFRDYAVKIIRTLQDIQSGSRVEYQGYIYAIYSLVRVQTDNPGVVLLQIRENTDMLITGLKNLSTGIKGYIDELTKYSTVAEIMDTLFNDYIVNVVDKAYHRLLTSDNVSKFRPEIIERLESKSRSRRYVESAAAELAEIREIPPEDAEELVYRYLHEIIEAFRNMDDILDEINRKNTQYQKSAVNRAKFQLTGNEDVRGQLKELLSGIGEEIANENLDMGGIYRLEFLDGLVRLYSSSFMDENSFYSPVEGKKAFVPQKLQSSTVTEAERQRKFKAMAAKLERILSSEKIEEYVFLHMGSADYIYASDLPLETDEEFIKLIYVRLYGQRKNMKYTIETGVQAESGTRSSRAQTGGSAQNEPGGAAGEVCTGGYRFRNFTIRRKK